MHVVSELLYTSKFTSVPVRVLSFGHFQFDLTIGRGTRHSGHIEGRHFGTEGRLSKMPREDANSTDNGC